MYICFHKPFIRSSPDQVSFDFGDQAPQPSQEKLSLEFFSYFFLLFKNKMIESYELKNPKKSILNMYQSKSMDICFIPVHAPEWLDLEKEKGLPNLKLSRLFLIQPIIFSLFIFSSLEFLSYCYKSIKIKPGLWPRIIVKMPA